MSLENSKIRKIILVEHDGLRGNLQSIEALLDQVAAGDVTARQSAHQQLNALLQTFLRHIEHEERILQPVLACIDAWGPQRKAAMDEEHAMQRELVTQLTTIDPSGRPGGLGARGAHLLEGSVDRHGRRREDLPLAERAARRRGGRRRLE